MNDNRPSTPSAVRRVLRKESGFGCCLCGHPFIQYHHIVPWHEDQHFRPEDMMTLCAQCHHLCTVEAIPISDQRTAKSRPKNIVDNELKGRLWVTSRELRVNLAGGTAIETPNLLQIAGETVLGARLDQDTGRVLISAQIRAPDGKLLAKIVDNEWSMRPDSVWDFEVFPRHATVRLGPADIAFSVDTRGDSVNLQGKWFHNGHKIEFSQSKATIGNNQLVGFNVAHCNVMISVG